MGLNSCPLGHWWPCIGHNEGSTGHNFRNEKHQSLIAGRNTLGVGIVWGCMGTNNAAVADAPAPAGFTTGLGEKSFPVPSEPFPVLHIFIRVFGVVFQAISKNDLGKLGSVGMAGSFQ